MDIDEQHLKDKALLLLRRERELFAMRTKHEQVTLWLRLTQQLPQLIDHTTPAAEIYGRLRKSLISGFRLQRVAFLELAPGRLRSIAPPGPDRALPGALAAFLETRRTGVCNEPGPDDPDLAALADAVGLHRFLWSEIRVSGASPVLLVAGFDKRIAPFQTAFDDSDAAHLDNVAQHVQTLLGNAALVRELERERETLERRVVERTEALARRTRDMRLVLDNVDQAFLTIDSDGRLAQERSAMVDRWFGPFEGQPSFVEYIGGIDLNFADSFAVAHDALNEGFLPRDLCLAQLPVRLRGADRLFHCTYFPLPDNASAAGLLIVITDVTEQLRREQDEAEQTELLALFQAMMRDRSGYLAFADETAQIVEGLNAGAAPESFDCHTTRRLLHNLKGSAAMVGANVIAGLCHQAEDELAEDPSAPPRAPLERLTRRWRVITHSLATILGDRVHRIVEVPRPELDALAEEIRAGISTTQLLERMASWQSEEVQLPLGRLAQYARALAQRLGKGALEVTIAAPHLRLDPARWGGLWSALVQVVRNAVDHGIEPSDERRARAKPPGGRLQLRVEISTAELVVELEDDGRGIDWVGVAAVAARRRLPHHDRAALLQALLSDGFSTRPVVTATSGRGVGLSVVRDQTLALGGRLTVTSEEGRGCCWRLCFPRDRSALGPSTVAAMPHIDTPGPAARAR